MCDGFLFNKLKTYSEWYQHGPLIKLGPTQVKINTYTAWACLTHYKTSKTLLKDMMQMQFLKGKKKKRIPKFINKNLKLYSIYIYVIGSSKI